MTTTPQPQVMSYGSRPPIGRRVNWRMIVILGVFGVLVGYPVFTYVKATMNGGIEHTANGELVDLKAMGNFPFDEHNGSLADVPADFRKLDGKRVILEGFMYDPQNATDQTHAFQFVYNVSKCCFSGPPKVQERVYAVVPHGAVEFRGQEAFVRLTGTMHVAIVKDSVSGTVSSVYTLDVAKEPEPL